MCGSASYAVSESLVIAKVGKNSMKILLYYEEKRLKRELLNLKTEKKRPKIWCLGILVVYLQKRILKLSNMARPIKETPILYGEDAKRFEERMNNVQKETPEQRKIRLEHYHAMLAALHRGEQMRKEGKTIPGIIKV